MQHILNVLTPATSVPPAGPYDLVSLDEMKMKLMIPPTTTTFDALLTELITNTSETIARMCNRVFAQEQVDENFLQLNDGNGTTQRLYLSRWPVALTDIVSINQNGNDILTSGTWMLEESTGTLYQLINSGPWYGTVEVVYTGGYVLPDGAPGTLKFCCEAIIRESYMSWIRNPALFGVRMISHKELHLGYYGPNLFPTTGLPDTWKTVNALLSKYIRNWV